MRNHKEIIKVYYLTKEQAKAVRNYERVSKGYKALTEEQLENFWKRAYKFKYNGDFYFCVEKIGTRENVLLWIEENIKDVIVREEEREYIDL